MPTAAKTQPEGEGVSCPPGRDRAMEADVLDRLKRIEGQVRGIQKMVMDRRDCADIITQLAAVKAAVSRVSLTVLTCHLIEGVVKDLESGRDVKDTLTELMGMFRKLS